MAKEVAAALHATPLLPPVVAEAVRLDRIETRTLGSRVIYERYGAPAISRTDTACRRRLVPSSLGVGESGRSDVSERVDEMLAEGFGA